VPSAPIKKALRQLFPLAYLSDGKEIDEQNGVSWETGERVVVPAPLKDDPEDPNNSRRA